MKIIEVIKEGDALAGKAFEWLRDEGEKVIVIIETEAGKVEAAFHKSNVKESSMAPVPVTTTDVAASTADVATAAPSEIDAAVETPDVEAPAPIAKANADGTDTHAGTVAGAPVGGA